MVTIIDQQLGQVSHPATSPPQPQLEFIIRRIQKFLVPVPAQPFIHRLAHKQGLMANIIHAVKQHLVIVLRLFPLINLPPTRVHENHVPEKRLPIRMLPESLGHLPERPWTEAIIRIQNDDDLALRSRDPFVHRVIMALVLF